ncbi:class I SAM-dependent methyltransferase [Aliigemmobacter aestuarii]|uniref:Class I SAM-dependent methyltransferase n=1 Tax=Aliigemmobacter aestuarii TaxID=1445661 RepID=A0A4S3MT79_9RHOB|nr:class I SAM-dependent methyltransferase [Gemmobacter aestuarii]THD85075.1 class I SAM-dependent methyltransferase [Gemmobacter aestuarii]
MSGWPYLAAGFYDRALTEGRHRDIVGGRWDETGRAQMAILRAEGMQPHHRLLDIGCGALRLGCKAVPFLEPGHYWGTDASGALMRRGWETELADRDKLPLSHLVEDADFSLTGIPEDIDYAIAFGVFTHLPGDPLRQVMASLATRQPRLTAFLFTVFLAPDAEAGGPFRQADGVVTHPDRAPRHMREAEVCAAVASAGWTVARREVMLPRGQILFVARPPAGAESP